MATTAWLRFVLLWLFSFALHGIYANFAQCYSTYFFQILCLLQLRKCHRREFLTQLLTVSGSYCGCLKLNISLFSIHWSECGKCGDCKGYNFLHDVSWFTIRNLKSVHNNLKTKANLTLGWTQCHLLQLLSCLLLLGHLLLLLNMKNETTAVSSLN